MCRFALYVGPPILLDSLVTRPANSIIHQSFHAHERSSPLNGDGFGVAWYARDVGASPALFRSVLPAWGNRNLLELARVTRSECVLAHVRAASPGMPVAEGNCHPFTAGPFSFMHNGSLAGFPRVRRRLLASLSDEAFGLVQGSTDSEHLFALFTDEHRLGTEPDPAERLAGALARTIARAVELTRQCGVEEASHLNIAVSDGRNAVVSRVATAPARGAPSLYVHAGKRYVCEGCKCRMVEPDEAGGAVLVCSEPLSEDEGWIAVPESSLVVIREDRTFTVRALPRDGATLAPPATRVPDAPASPSL